MVRAGRSVFAGLTALSRSSQPFSSNRHTCKSNRPAAKERADDDDNVLDRRAGVLFVFVLILTSQNRAGQWASDGELKESQASDADSQAMQST